MSPAPAPAAVFSLRIPETWFEFDIWRATRTGDLSRMVDQRIEALPQLGPHRSAILRGLRQLAKDAEQAGAVYCAAAADRVADDGTFLASLMVFSTAGTAEPALNTPEAIAAQITAVPPSAGSPDWREVQIIELPIGRAVRVRGLRTTTSPDGGQSLPIVSMQTLIPIPGSEGVLNVVLSSPLVSLTEGLLDLFDAISSTLNWQPGPSPR
jgi:hypothetical protein